MPTGIPMAWARRSRPRGLGIKVLALSTSLVITLYHLLHAFPVGPAQFQYPRRRQEKFISEAKHWSFKDTAMNRRSSLTQGML